MISVIWHSTPDTDAITSALVYAHYLREIGEQAQAIRLWDINKETQYVLDQAKISSPKLVTSLDEGSHIALVDHNESTQSIDHLDRYQLHSVVDHHKLWDLETSHPLLLRFEALASTNSILYKMYQERGVVITAPIATLMLGGIISDTLYFRSPTTTSFEKSVVPKLASIAEISDVEAFASTMFSEKSDLGDISIYDLIKNVDAKDFTFGGKKSLVACIETTNPDYCLARKDEIVETISDIKSKEWYDCVLFCTIDILNEKNTTIVADKADEQVLEKAFGARTTQGIADLGDRISRKKTIIPPLQEALS